MTRIIFFIFVLVSLLPFTGCEEEINYDYFRAEEDRYFHLYMDANYPELAPTESGLYFIEFEEGEGLSPDSGDYLLINFLAYTVPDEKEVDTYTEEWARRYNLYNDKVLYGPYKYEYGTGITGLYEGLSMMKEGGIARLIFKSDLGYGSAGMGNIGRFESLMYDIELVEVIADPVQNEQEQIDAFLSENPTAYPVKDKETGVTMYYIPGVAGDSAQIAEGNSVEVFYTGRLLDGRVFDSNEGSSKGMSVKVGEGEVIAGWDIGLKWFRYGGKGQLLIPHQLAYGAEGSKVQNSNKISIPPYEALLFDIRISKAIIEEDDK
ncbi:MAG: FKBP-type peptidyl-prolyl cis-trans isomerase [Bacteroidales bacterium]